MWFAQCPTDWRGCRDFLARRHPLRWGPTAALKEACNYATDDEVARVLGNSMERWLREHDIDVPLELSSNGQ